MRKPVLLWITESDEEVIQKLLATVFKDTTRGELIYVAAMYTINEINNKDKLQHEQASRNS